MTTLAAYFHELDPIILRVHGDLAFRWYGLAYIAGFIVAYVILARLSKRGLILLPRERVYDAMFWLVAGTIVGGRLGYALFYDPGHRLLTTFTSTPPFWKLFALNEGGMASHGGMIGLTLACVRVSRGWKNERDVARGRSPLLHVMDYVALVAPFGVFFGRLANFINGELLGKIVTPPGTPGPWWSVQYPQELTEPVERLAQTREDWAKIAELGGRVAPGKPLEDQLTILAHSMGRHKAELVPLLSSRHPSQLYQAIAEGVVLGAVLWIIWLKPRKAGVITAWFFIVYGVLRILTELVRLPDANMQNQAVFGLSRGQQLSVAMIFVGAGLLIWLAGKDRPRFGGWLKPSGA